MNLLSDAAQSQTWPKLAPLITKGKTLYFSHGFSVVYKDDTHVIPPADVVVPAVASTTRTAPAPAEGGSLGRSHSMIVVDPRAPALKERHERNAPATPATRRPESQPPAPTSSTSRLGPATMFLWSNIFTI